MSYEMYLRRKDKLLISAIELLDESGIAGVTTKEMAKREGISEPAVYRHFDGKLEILMAIINKFAVFDSQLENTVNEQKMDPIAAIRYICGAYASYYSSYPQIASVMFSIDLMKYNPAVEERMKEIITHRKQVYEMLVIQAQKLGLMGKSTDSKIIAGVIFGIVWQETYQWKLFDMGYSLQERVSTILDIILKDGAKQ